MFNFRTIVILLFAVAALNWATTELDPADKSGIANKLIERHTMIKNT